MSNLVDFAKDELARIDHSDDMQDLMDRDILELIETFSNQEHSNISGAYVLGMFNRLVVFMPVTPITGDDDEWVKVSDNEELYQNKRCGSVFKDKDGKAYDINHTLPDGSMKYIEFPYYPV